MSSSDSVNHPSHYNAGKIEVIEAIEDWKLDYHLGNAVKYIVRAGKKEPTKVIEDLEKAIWYIYRRIAVLQGNPPKPNDMPQKRFNDPMYCTKCGAGRKRPWKTRKGSLSCYCKGADKK